MNQSIINIAKGEEVFSSTLDFFFMNICTWTDGVEMVTVFIQTDSVCLF